MGVGACNKANADAVKTCLIFIPVYNVGQEKLEVLKDVSLSVDDGQVVAILGPSGSGKTTLLRCINFLERADAGTLVFGDTYDLHKASSKDILKVRRKTAFVFQNYGLFANKTALQNVMEGLTVVQKIPKKEAIKKAEDALELVGLLDKKIITLHSFLEDSSKE